MCLLSGANHGVLCAPAIHHLHSWPICRWSAYLSSSPSDIVVIVVSDVTFITIPQIANLLTSNEFVIGLLMVPLVFGTLVGSKLAGKLARPKSQALTAEQRLTVPRWESRRAAPALSTLSDTR